MSKTTQTTFPHPDSGDTEVSYEKNFVIIRAIKKNGGVGDSIFVENSEIKRINRIINKNAKEN